LVATALFVGGSAIAQQAAGDAAGQSAGAATDADKMFIKNTAVVNMAEMKLAQAAQDKAQSPEVKKLAQDMLKDHQAMDQKIKEVAQKTGVQLPQDLPEEMKENVQTISQLQGDEFDKQFVSAAKAAHAAAISRFGDEAKIAKSQDVKQFASEQLPTLQHHGEQIVACASAEGLGTESLGQAQPAGATIQPSQGQQRQPGYQRDSGFTPNSAQQQQQK
jgi:putative membrane protein